MESLDTAAYLMEELLDFPSDVDEKDSSSSDAADKVDRSALSPEECVEEEELEWLSNKDAFPTVDTFVDIITGNPSCDPRGCQYKHRSPVSVLENITNITTSSSSNITTSSIMTTCLSGRFAPVQRARTPRWRKRRHDQQLASFSEKFHMSIKKNNSGNAMKTSSDSCSIGRKCQHCQAEKTPQWRAGPMGAKTLCNACGVRYKSGRLVPEYRPANSPTFSSKLHSNSHRKVVEMRRQKHGCNSDVVNAAASVVETYLVQM